jgi:transposase
MIYKTKINTDISIKTLNDLHKLKPFLEDGTLKINRSQLARDLGKDRRTVDKYLKGYEKPARRDRSSNIDEYYDLITDLLSDTNQQIFYYKRILWQYLKDNHGLQCAQSSFRRYIQHIPEFQSYFEKKVNTSKKVHIRFETEPGRQAQLDWKESIPFTLSSGETVDINIFVLLLSFSRFRLYRVSLSKCQDILLSFLDDAFETFGGIPQEILTDNMKTVMDEARTEYKAGTINLRFSQFASDYGFKVQPCIAGRPQTKAKVEAPMKLLDEIRAYNGLLNYTELNELVLRINTRVNHEVNSGTGRIPLLYFQKEKASLSPLPKESIRKPYKISTTTVKVNPSSMISYQSNQYSVPPEYIGKQMNLQVYDNHLYVYYSTTFVTLHPISSRKLNYHEQHYIKLSRLTMRHGDDDIRQIAKDNLKLIGAMYQNE